LGKIFTYIFECKANASAIYGLPVPSSLEFLMNMRMNGNAINNFQ